MYAVPIYYNGDHSKLVGSISLTPEVEMLLEEGDSFVISASVVKIENKMSKIAAINLTPIEAEEARSV